MSDRLDGPVGPADYGRYSVESAELISLPQWTGKGVISVPPPQGIALRDLVDAKGKPIRKTRNLGTVYNSGNKGRRGIFKRKLPVRPRRAPVPIVVLPPPPPPPRTVSTVGVMDVGAAGCNLLINNNAVGASVPEYYFDMGSPIPVFLGSVPNTLRLGNPAWAGPIISPGGVAPVFQVVLSHWDYDHWRLGHNANVTNVQWLYVVQPVGPAATAFILALGGNSVIYGGAPSTSVPDPGDPLGPPLFTIYQCNPGGGLPAFVMNNSGLSMSVPLRLPTGDPAMHQFFMTADANFTSLPAVVGMFNNLTGISAVHHGSIAYNCSLPANLPPQDPAYVGQGRLAYSYGIRVNAAGNWSHPYGFPVPGAVANYTAAGWGTAGHLAATAEPVPVNGMMPPAARGNIAVAAVPVFGAPYNATAFGPYQFNLN